MLINIVQYLFQFGLWSHATVFILIFIIAIKSLFITIMDLIVFITLMLLLKKEQ
jgi:hypothetical protein